jgi:ABC-2 type transport system permease protein
VLRSEWIKLTTLRSTWWSIVSVAALSLGLSAMFASIVAFSMRQGNAAVTGAGIGVVLGPTQFTMLLAGLLGVIAVTGEYATGMIRSTLTVVPRRALVLAGKATAVALLLAAASALIFAAAILLTTPLLGAAAIDWSQPAAVLRPLGCGVLTMACFALIGSGIGFMLRNGPGAITVTAALLFILPAVPSMIPPVGPLHWLRDLEPYLPVAAAESLMTAAGDAALSPWVALATLLGWTLAILLGGWAVLQRRDA